MRAVYNQKITGELFTLFFFGGGGEWVEGFFYYQPW